MSDKPDEHEKRNNDNIITLYDDEGNDTEFEFIDIINYKNDNYMILLPCDDPEEVVILRIDEAEYPEEDNYVEVEDENVLDAVFEIFKEEYKDVFHFE